MINFPFHLNLRKVAEQWRVYAMSAKFIRNEITIDFEASIGGTNRKRFKWQKIEGRKNERAQSKMPTS